MAQCRKSGGRAKRKQIIILSQKRVFLNDFMIIDLLKVASSLKMAKRSFKSMLGSNELSIVISCCNIWNCIAMFVDLADILKTSKQFSNPSKRSNVFFEILALNAVLVFLIFLPRYYGSCYRLQHVEKKTQKRHVKEQTCQTVGTCRKEKKGERRQKKRKGAKIARCLIKKTIEVEINFILFVSTLGTIQAFLYTLLRGL